MQIAPLFGIASSLGAALLWSALVGITVLAIVLYWPRRFSGPLTEHERRAARRALRGRSLLLAFVTPAAALVGFMLLLPPPVALIVQSQVMRGERNSATPAARGSLLSRVSLHRSLDHWTCGVLHRAMLLSGPGRTPDEETLRTALLEAARDGFPGECDAIEWDAVDAWRIVSVELSLVELAARAYLLTSVTIDRGPPVTDPDPWDLMARTLKARGIPVELPPARSSQQGAMILRLGRARMNDTGGSISVLAVVQGDLCGARYPGRLSGTSQESTVDLECELIASADGCSQTTPAGQQAIELTASCGSIPADVTSWVLSAGYGQALVVSERAHTIPVSGDITDALKLIQGSDVGAVFEDDLRKHDLAPLRIAGESDSSDISVGFEDDGIVVRSRSLNVGGDGTAARNRLLHLGPFSWAGFPRQPEITCENDHIEIGVSPELLRPGADVFDPTSFYATMHTITWAANALRRGSCDDFREPLPVSPIQPRPLLSAEEIDRAVSALNRERETAGLVLLALAVLSLALGLRRSVR